MTESAQPALPIFLSYLQALSPTIIAALVAWVAFMQWKTNNDRLKFELYDKRWAVFDYFYDLLWQVECHAAGVEDSKPKELLNELPHTTWQQRFIFDHEINEFTDYITDNIRWIYDRQFREIVDEPYHGDLDADAIREWARARKSELEVKFQPYLRISTHRPFRHRTFLNYAPLRATKPTIIERDMFAGRNKRTA